MGVDMVNKPPHYNDHPSGVECIQITEHLPFCLGNAIKYLWRQNKKGSAAEDLKKAAWYFRRESSRISTNAPPAFFIQQEKLAPLLIRVAMHETGPLRQVLNTLASDHYVTSKMLAEFAELIELSSKPAA